MDVRDRERAERHSQEQRRIGRRTAVDHWVPPSNG
jgi:hypothetical protein